jgi:hypothetical protein
VKSLRQIHLYLGCIFAPLILYFALSGAWQIFRLNDVEKNETAKPTLINSILHGLSNPHTHSTLPGLNPKTDQSVAFNWIAFFMSLGIVVTTFIGLILAFRMNRSKTLVVLCLVLGIFIPVVLLYLH